ncbi:MAG: hypothetical protein AB8I08_08640 [Sandaracinaceae bacterium]
MAKRAFETDPRLMQDWAARRSLRDSERALLEAVLAGRRGQELNAQFDGSIAEAEMAFARATGVSVYSVAKDLLARQRLARDRPDTAER